MTTIDANGIIRYEDTDGAPTPPVLNLGLQSVSDALGPYVNKVKWTGTGTGLSANFFTNDVNSEGARLRLGVDGSVRIGRVGDDVLRFLPFAMQQATRSVTFTSRSSFNVAISFTANLFTSPPNVTTNIATGAGAAAGWISRATSVTPTGFNLYLAKVTSGDSAWSDLPVQWTATQLTP